MAGAVAPVSTGKDMDDMIEPKCGAEARNSTS